MTLPIRALHDRYTIEREIGRGGMATVYLAHDAKHDRDVAVKVLHEDLGATLGPERFLAEIKTTAKLQHPHILPLLDSGEADGALFYVMPYVEGETLRDRLTRETQLPIDDALRIAREVADALGFAHGHGIIHRDIKPENILLQGGHALVADFGIALAVQRSAGARLTQTGLSLGTPQYMAPEQAMGDKTVDHHADIYALGAVTYEMLTGEPPFTGATVQAIVARVMNERPTAITTLRDTVSDQVNAAVMKALAKLPADRFVTAPEFASALVTMPASGRTPGVAAFGASTSRWKYATTVLALALLVALGVITTRTGSPQRTVRVEVEAGAYFGVLNVPVVVGAPDGSSFVYCDAAGEVWIRRWTSLAPARVPDAGAGCYSLAFSPDGKRLAIIGVPTSLRIVSLAGDSPARNLPVRDFGDISSYGGSVDWGSDDNLYVVSRRGVMRVSTVDGQATVVATNDSANTRLSGIDVLPGAQAALVVAATRSPTMPLIQRIGVVDFRTGKTELILQGRAARYAKPGYLLVARNDTLVAVPFDLGTLRPSGAEVPLADRIAVRYRAGLGIIDVTDDGTLLYWRSAGTDFSRPVFVDRAGGVKEIGQLRLVDRFSEPRLSSDDALLAMEVNDGVVSRTWVRDLRSGRNTVIAKGGWVNGRPTWRPDSKGVTKALTIVSDSSGAAALWEWPIDGGAMRAMPAYDRRPIFATAWSRNGEWLLVRTDDQAKGKGDILAVRIGIDSVAVPILADSGYGEFSPVLSPDGHWLAYVSNKTGRAEVYVTSFPTTRGELKISDGGGTDVVWSHSGRELFFVSLGHMMAADIAAEPAFRVVRQRTLFDITPFLTGSYARRYFDVTSDDQRFLMLRRNEDLMTTRIVAVFNWVAELKSRGKR